MFEPARKKIGDEFGKKIGEAFKNYLTTFYGHFDETKKEVLFAFERDHDLIGRVLKSHLIVESYLDRCIQHLNNGNLNIKFDKLSLRFVQKIELLEPRLDGFDSYFQGIKKLNTIRNKFAHDLRYDLTLTDVQTMIPYVEFYRKERLIDPVRVIEDFATIACALLRTTTSEQFSDIPKLYCVLAKMVHTDPELFAKYSATKGFDFFQ